MTEVSQAVKDKLAEALEVWAEETLEGKPALLGTGVYFTMCRVLQEETDKINTTFGE